jgi:hypothetical protein
MYVSHSHNSHNQLKVFSDCASKGRITGYINKRGAGRVT